MSDIRITFKYPAFVKDVTEILDSLEFLIPLLESPSEDLMKFKAQFIELVTRKIKRPVDKTNEEHCKMCRVLFIRHIMEIIKLAGHFYNLCIDVTMFLTHKKDTSELYCEAAKVRNVLLDAFDRLESESLVNMHGRDDCTCPNIIELYDKYFLKKK